MNPEDIGRALDEIGQRIGPYGEAAWSILVKQMFVEGLVGAVLWTLVSVGLAIVGKKIYNALRISPNSVAEAIADKVTETHTKYSIIARDYVYRDTKSALEDTSFWSVGAISAVAVTLIALGFTLSAVGTSVMRIVNPEYYALMKLMEALP